MTDNKLTDEEIERAFEICYGIDKVVGCTFCPLYDEEDFCQRGDVPLEEQFFDVYTRQKAEKEALINGQETLQKHIAELKAEIERLQAEIESLNKAYPCTVKMNEHCLVYARSLDDYDKLIGEISSEGTKEFAERLKEKAKYFYCKKDNGFYEECSLIETDIVDNLLKEMEGE